MAFISKSNWQHRKKEREEEKEEKKSIVNAGQRLWRVGAVKQYIRKISGLLSVFLWRYDKNGPEKKKNIYFKIKEEML